MRMIATTLAVLLVAGCSDGKDAAAAASESAAATATSSASPTPTPSEKPLTAQSCIDDNKGMGTGVRGENTKDCLVQACDQGDKKSCEMTKSFGGNPDQQDEPDPDADSGADQDSTAR